jgi:hypothetical protein
MMEQKQTWQERVEKLEKQKQGINAGDAFNFASTAAVAGLILHDISTAFENNITQSLPHIMLYLDGAQNIGGKEVLLKELFLEKEQITKAVAILEKGGNNVDRQIGELFNSKPKYRNDLLTNISNDFPGGMNGAIATIAILVGFAVASSRKTQDNQMIDAQIAKIKQQPENPSYSEMVRLREAIENTQATGQGAKR